MIAATLSIAGPTLRATPDARGWTRRFVGRRQAWTYVAAPYTLVARTPDRRPPEPARPVVVALHRAITKPPLVAMQMSYRDWLDLDADVFLWLAERRRRLDAGIRDPLPAPPEPPRPAAAAPSPVAALLPDPDFDDDDEGDA